jgi:APA family basic amino acid/polyamine antiporter
MQHDASSGPNFRHDLPRSIGFWGATGVMVGVIIGSGIFATPLTIAGHVGSPLNIMLFWLAGGVLALCGAMTYAELAAMHPESGGVYVFLREGYGRCMAFVFGWTFMLITKPAAAAAIPIVFGTHLNKLLGTSIDPRLISIALLIGLTALNVTGLRTGSVVAVVLTAAKFGALLVIVSLGAVVLGRTGALAPGAWSATWTAAAQPVPLLLAVAPVMAAVLWTYDGWSDIGAIAGEVRDPGRQLPRIYLVGTAAITLIYLAVNGVYMAMVPIEEMRSIVAAARVAGTDATIAPIVVERLLSGLGFASLAGGVAVTIMILVSTLGSTHGSIITGARVTYAQARDGLLFGVLSRVHPRYATPAVALWTQCALSCTACWFLETFAALSATFVFTMWIFYGLAGASIFILRARRPDAARPFRCWGYPFVPAIFVLSSVTMTVITIADNPWGSLPWLGVLLAGVPIYFIWNAAQARAATTRPPA